MDTKLKQRLIGAVILTCLVVILLPLLLDGTEEERTRVFAEIPEPPAIELSEITIQDVQRRMVQMEEASEARLPKEIVDDTDYEASPDFILDKNNLPVNWSLQLGSFRDQENATRLRAQLREQNYRSYILKPKTGDEEIYRVFVGPSSSKAALAEMNAEIEQKLQLKGRIVRYRVEEDREQLGG